MVITEKTTQTSQEDPTFSGFRDILKETEKALLLLLNSLERENRAIVERKLQDLEDAMQDKAKAMDLLSQSDALLKQASKTALSQDRFLQGKTPPFISPFLLQGFLGESFAPYLKRVVELKEKSLKLNEDNCTLLEDCITISDQLYGLLSGLTASGFVYQASGAFERRAMTGRLMSGAV